MSDVGLSVKIWELGLMAGIQSMIIFVCNIPWRHNFQSSKDNYILKKDLETYQKYILTKKCIL